MFEHFNVLWYGPYRMVLFRRVIDPGRLTSPNFQDLKNIGSPQDPDGEIENSGKSIFEIRIPNFCYIQVIDFDLSYLKYKKRFSHFFMVAYLLSPNSCHWQIAQVKNYNLNVTEVLVSDFKNAFSRNFNFIVGILLRLPVSAQFKISSSNILVCFHHNKQL